MEQRPSSVIIAFRTKSKASIATPSQSDVQTRKSLGDAASSIRSNRQNLIVAPRPERLCAARTDGAVSRQRRLVSSSAARSIQTVEDGLAVSQLPSRRRHMRVRRMRAHAERFAYFSFAPGVEFAFLAFAVGVETAGNRAGARISRVITGSSRSRASDTVRDARLADLGQQLDQLGVVVEHFSKCGTSHRSSSNSARNRRQMVVDAPCEIWSSVKGPWRNESRPVRFQAARESRGWRLREFWRGETATAVERCSNCSRMVSTRSEDIVPGSWLDRLASARPVP